jgi:glucose/arabinose dehydrogenase
MKLSLRYGVPLFGAALLIQLATVLAQPAPGGAAGPAPAPAGAAGARGGGGAGAGGRAGGILGGPVGGINAATATLFNGSCAGCHGTGLEGGRAKSLFNKEWLGTVDDDRIRNAIKNGVPNTEMVSWSANLTDDQIWQLVTYIRQATATANPRPPFNDSPDGLVIKGEKQTFKVEVLTTDLYTPWGLAFLPDGRLLITERKGTIRILDKNNVISPPVKNTPTPHVQQDGGFLDIEVHPNYAQNGWIYLAYSEVQPGYAAQAAAVATLQAKVAPQAAAFAAARTALATASFAEPRNDVAVRQAVDALAAADLALALARADAFAALQAGPAKVGAPQLPGLIAAMNATGPAGNPPSMTVWVRGKINANNEWTNQETIVRFPENLYTNSGTHFGSRFLFDTQGHLFFTIGERGQMTNAQDLSIPLGKVHRINDDGSIPRDNPFVNTPGAVPSIWTYGHRNPEGLAWEPGTGVLWESEHGPTNGDEVNLLIKGHNYGWGVVSKGSQGGITLTSAPGMDDPIVYYTPTLAPAGMTFYTGNRYPGWRNTSLFVGGLAGQRLMRLEVANGKVTHQEEVFNTFGRVRDLAVGPDGLFYIALQNPGPQLAGDTPGKLIRLQPQ